MNKILIIGLGSMGKRRIRCLLALGFKKESIIGLDMREDRRQESYRKYGISVACSVNDIDFSEIKAVIVSLPPDKHAIGAKIAIDHNKPVFIEASVILEDVKEIKAYNNGRVFVAPSCTMVFHPIINDIREIVMSGKYGKICNFSYHSGQYLPDWHPWEDVNEFYVGQRNTGGAREIVSFEFTWLVNLMGFPEEVKGYYRKTIDFGCDIEDSYVSAISYRDKVGMMTVDVAARYAVRNLIINLEEAQIQWRWDKKRIEIFEAAASRWIYMDEPVFANIKGYNENINENMYVSEIKSFLKGIEDEKEYPNNLDKDIKVLELLGDIEDSDGGFNRVQL